MDIAFVYGVELACLLVKTIMVSSMPSQMVQESRGDWARTKFMQREVEAVKVSQPRFDPMNDHFENRTR